MSKLSIYRLSQKFFEMRDKIENLESIFWKESAYDDGEFSLKTRDKDILRKVTSGTFLACDVEGVRQDEYYIMVVQKIEYSRDSRGALDITISGKNASILWKYRPCLPNIESINKEVNELSGFTPKQLMELAMLRGKEYGEKNGYGFEYEKCGNLLNERFKDNEKIEKYDLGRRTVYDICREMSQAYMLSFYALSELGSGSLKMMVHYPLDYTNSFRFDYDEGHILTEKFCEDDSDYHNEIRVFTPDESESYKGSISANFIQRLGFADHSDFEDERAKVEAQQKANIEAVTKIRQRAESGERDYTPLELAEIYRRALESGLYELGYYYEQRARAEAKAKELFLARKNWRERYECEFSTNLPMKYPKHYTLGMVVEVKDSMGKERTMLINSFVRYEEKGMYKEYPEMSKYVWN